MHSFTINNIQPIVIYCTFALIFENLINPCHYKQKNGIQIFSNMLDDNNFEEDHKDGHEPEIDDISDIQLEESNDTLGAAHDDFDWSVGKRNTVKYSSDEEKRYFEQYDNSLNSVSELEVVKGRVTAIHSGDVVLDINYKSDGLVSLSEFRDMPELKVGDYVDVYVENKEDYRGQLVLSRRKAKLLKAWDNLVDSYKNGTIIKGLVISKTKGGLIVDCLGLETFLPGSQIDVKPITDYDIYVGKTMEFKVVKINEAIKNAVVSHKALIESDLAEQRETIISGLEKGQVLEGVVKNITDFGAFMDLGGVDGLLYITDISWGRINHPNEVLSLNQKLNVVVLDFGEDKKRISLGLKQLTPHPWEVLDKTISEGSVVKGKIVNIEDYGAFLEIIPGVEGLIHVSEVNWSNQPVNARDFFTLGQDMEAKVVTIDRDDRKMSLSVKQLTQDPWSEVAAKYKIGSKHTGEVKNLTPYGVFVELENGIGGMVHISDLSWTKRYSHPSEFTKVGEKIDVSILEVDEDSRKLSLGHKQLEENPWDTFENVFPVGSYHEATIIKKDDRGAVVQLPYGLEAYAPIKHLKKDDNSTAGADETLTFKVIEFNRDDKRIIVSHTRYLDDIRKEADQMVESEKTREKEEVKKTIKATQSKVELSTFGDIEGFSELKEQMAAASAPAAKEPAKAEKAPKAAKAGKGDEFRKIEGIGPKIEELLHEAGYNTFADLAAADVDAIKEVLNAAGSRYQMHDPTSWPMQADMAAKGEWDALKEWQENAKGGKVEE
jgi:small subunit ribosomal protein S1